MRSLLFAVIFGNVAAFAQPHRSLAQPHQSQFIPNHYTLILADPPVAERFTSRDALETAQADSYRRQIETAQAAVKSEVAARNFQVLGSVSEVLNAVFVAAPASRLADLQSIPGVARVVPARKMKINLNRATTLANAPAAWTAVGGQSKAGAGIKIGIIDTGIDQTHPALQDSSLSTPSGFPKGDSNFTTNKVIVARSYVSMLSDTNPTDSYPDDFTARDRQGHGTFNAIVAAGNSTGTPAAATAGGPITISGMAPKAWLGNYKVEGSPGVQEFASDQNLIAAVNDAVKDGMDVISCSIGGSTLSDAASDPLAAAFEAATKSAVVVVAAGDGGADSYNNGYQYPGFNTIISPGNAPDAISVGATINSHVLQASVSVNASSAPSNLKGIAGAYGDSYFYPSTFGASQAPLVDITKLGNDGTACAALPANSLTGSYALILRGNCTFDTKALNTQNAGAIGFIYYMADSSTPINPEGINEYGPSVMISNSDGLNLKNYIDSNPGALVTVDLNGIEQELTAWSTLWGFSPAVAANQFASYSSMGPTPDGQLKPDMVATGGLDPELGSDPNDPYLPAPNGMYSGSQNYDPNQAYYANLFSSNRYAGGAGSSFSAPLTAGAAALLKQAHPTLRPTQIKSLLVNYAAQDTTTDDFGDQVDIEWLGAGRLDAGAASSANVTAEPSTVSFGILNGATLPMTKTISLTNISGGSISLNTSVVCCFVNGSPNGKLPNATVAVSPGSVNLAAGATASLSVTLSGTAPAASEYSGNVVLQNSSTTMRIPFMLLEGSGTVYNINPAGGGEGVPGEDVGPQFVQLTDAYGVPVANSSVTFSVSPRGSLTLQSVSGSPACAPASSTTTVVCPSDKFGFAWVEAVNGSTTASPSVNFTAAGNQGSFSYNIQAAPVITSASVVDAAIFKQPIAPGSYINIYGTGMSNYTDNNDATTDALSADGTYDILPLHIDFVTVTFDVPSAGISVPAHLTYVSPGVVQAQVPWELQGQSSAQVKVVLDGDLFGNVVTVPIANAAPQFFTNGNNIADALDTSYNLITTSHPAPRGQTIFMYANALGPVSNQPASGAPALGPPNLSNTTQPVTVNFGGQTATASFAGLAPGFPGLYQINVTVPTGAPTGSAVPVTITVNNQTSAQATIPVQ
ncbi:MAG TPA: S8 family serine peptidase [Bryobacteraceae bacterium]|nr:S8 family serine peptidase [Bryobacteraceae bacterium]